MADLNKLWEAQQNNKINLATTRIDNDSLIRNYVGTNLLLDKIFYLMSVDENVKVPDIAQFRFRGLQVFVLQHEGLTNIYIDLIDSDLRDIFTKFIEDVVKAVESCVSENQAVQETVRVILKWKKLFDKIAFGGLSAEAQKGLIGELLFFDLLLDRGYEPAEILKSWTADEYKDKDFIIGSDGYEIKFTASKKPLLRISSERQLDTQTLNSLTLVLYIADEVIEDGISLNIMVNRINSKLRNDVLANETFNNCLGGLGYLVEDAEHYNRMYKIKKSNFYRISKQFPKIIPVELMPGIKEVAYCIELSAAEPFLYAF